MFLLNFFHSQLTFIVLEPAFDSGGLHFPTAIFQLVIGLYCLEGCLVGLFLAFTTNPLKLWLSIMMFFTMTLTAVFHYRLRSVFNPVIKYVPLSLHKTQLNEGQLNILKSHTANQNNSDTRRASGRSASSYICETTNRFVPRKHSQTFSKLSANSGAQNCVNDPSDITDQSQNLHELEAGNIEETKLEHTKVIDSLTYEQNEYISKSAYNHYSLREVQPCIWLPQDDLGISDDQINEIRLNYSHILISNYGCMLDLDGKISIYNKPPDWTPSLNI